MNPGKCVECKTNQVRKENSSLCRRCFEIAKQDLFRNEKP